MKSNLKRLLSMALVLVMVLSLVPATVFAAEGDSAADAAQNVATGAQYADLSQAISEAQPGQIVKALANAQDVVYDNQGVILDLNGYDLSVTVSEGVTVSAIDSATDDYEGKYGTLTTDGKVATTVKTGGEVKSYVTIAENGSYSFHRYYAAIAAVSLKPTQVALGYRAEFRGDEAVKNAVSSYGYELWVNDGAHKTYTRTDALTMSSLTLRLQNIMAEGNEALNAIGSTATIGGNAFVTLELNGEQVKLSGTEKQTTLRQVIESVNANVASYGEAQLESVRAMITTYAAWMEGWNTAAIFGGNQGEGTEGDLKVEIVVDVVAQGNVLSQDATMSHGGISATVPAGAILEDGATQLVLTITEKTSSDSDVTQGEGESLIPLDVHIAGISADNTTPIIICLGEVLPKALNIGNYDLFHVEDGKTVPMTHVSIAELDAHNEFSYDPATGSVTVAMASFSEVTLRSKETGTWEGEEDHTWYNTTDNTLYIYNADQLWSFSQIVGGMAEGIAQDDFSGKTIVLHADIDLNDLTDENTYVFYPIGYYNSTKSYNKVAGKVNDTAVRSSVSSFEGTFDGNGHTISNFYQNTWEMFGDYNDGYSGTPNHYKDAMGLFGYVYGGTVKNLTVENFSSDGEFTPTGVIAAYASNSTFENISITNCNPRVYNTGNGGIVGIGGNDSDPDTYKLTFHNITIDNTNKITALWGSWDVACGGLVGMFRGAGHAYMTNCHVAAQIDVYNDVCGNYQYYWYRYAGMMIGTNKTMVTDENGYTVPETSKYHAENCTVHFGDWNDYYYCELVANSLASYTHDHQFSRLTPVNAITSDMPDGHYVYFENGTAKCYHMVNGAEYKHESAGTEMVNGVEVLKEDKQCVYLPFNQLFTGYGWGVKHIPVYNGEDYAFEGITILDRQVADSVEKFDKATTAKDSYVTGNEVTIGDLFTAIADTDVAIQSETVQVTVSPVGDDSTASGVYVANTSDWTKGTLTFSGKGAAEITITDYYFCKATTVTVEIGDTEQKQMTSVEDIMAGGTFVLVAEAGGKYYALSNATTADSDTKIAAQEVAVENGFVVVDESTALWVVTAQEDGTATLTFGDKYLYHSKAKDTDLSISTTSQGWTIKASEDEDNTFVFESTCDTDRSLAYSITNKCFRAYGNTNKNNTAYVFYLNVYRVKYADNTGSGDSGETECQHANQTTTTVDATCITAGSTTVTCDDCGETISTETIPATGHSYDSGEITTAPTCVNPGVKTYSCTVAGCNGTKTETIEATGHSYNAVVTAPTCDKAGYTTYTCSCGDSYTGNEVPATNKHTYENGICTGCGKEDEIVIYTVTFDAPNGQIHIEGNNITLPSAIAMTGYTFAGWSENENTDSAPSLLAGANYVPSEDITLYAVYSKTTQSSTAGYVTKNIADLSKEEDVVIVGKYNSKLYTMSNKNGTSSAPAAAEFDQTSKPTDEILWNIEKENDKYIIHPKGSTTTWLYSTNTNNGTRVGNNSNKTWQLHSTGYLKHTSTGRYLGIYNAQDWRSYTNTTGNTKNQSFYFYVWQEGSEGTTIYTTTPECAHSNVEWTETTTPTCEDAGEKTSICVICKETISTVQIPATGHNYVDGVCSCGATKPVATTKTETLSFASTTQRISQDSNKQVWKLNGITFTNNKASSSNAVANYTNPVRLYAGSNVVIEAKGITKIVFDCNSNDYATALKNSIGTVSGATVTVSSDKVTVTFTSGVESFTIAELTAQVRLDEITVTYTPSN